MQQLECLDQIMNRQLGQITADQHHPAGSLPQASLELPLQPEPQATLPLASGAVLSLSGRGDGVWLNGRALTQPRVSHADLVAGGRQALLLLEGG